MTFSRGFMLFLGVIWTIVGFFMWISDDPMGGLFTLCGIGIVAMVFINDKFNLWD